MNLDKSFIVILKAGKNNRKWLTQVIEAETSDEAIAKAMNTFDFRLHLSGYKRITKETQKCCKLTKIGYPLRFGFCAGWTTIKPDKNDTIYTMLEKAEKSKFVNGKTITDISNFIAAAPKFAGLIGIARSPSIRTRQFDKTQCFDTNH